VFKPQICKYYFSDCGVIGPLSIEHLNLGIFCKNICKRTILPIEQTSNYLCYIQLKEYLQYLMPQIYKFLRFDRPQTSQLCDITDGSEYRKVASQDTLVIYFGFDGASYVQNGEKSLFVICNMHLRTAV